MVLRRLPSGLLAVAIGLWVITLSRLIVARHNGYGTFDFDLGIHDQSLWLLAHGKSFNSVCGLPVFGHHAMFAYYALVPLVWLGGGPNLWNVLQVLALGLAAVPVFLIARERLDSDLAGLGAGVAWLLLPTVGFLGWETIHPETMAVPFLLMGYHYATTRPEGPERTARRHNIVTVAWLVAALAWKEDVALALLGLAVLLTVRGRRRFGPALLVGAALYFLVIGMWLVPHLAGPVTAYSELFGGLGGTPSEVVSTSLRHPSMFFGRLRDNNVIGYVGQVTSPLGFLPLLAPLVMLMALPQMLINILTVNDFTWAMMFHYQAVPNVAAICAAIEAAAFLRRRRAWLGTGAVAVMVVASCIAGTQWGVLPFGDEYDKGYWVHNARSTVGWDAALARVGPDDIVSAHYLFVPHITHRETVYTFPNPWIPSNFLGDKSKLVSPSEVRWLVILDGSLQGKEAELLDELLERGEYGDAQTIDGVTSYRRLLP